MRRRDAPYRDYSRFCTGADETIPCACRVPGGQSADTRTARHETHTPVSQSDGEPHCLRCQDVRRCAHRLRLSLSEQLHGWRCISHVDDQRDAEQDQIVADHIHARRQERLVADTDGGGGPVTDSVRHPRWTVRMGSNALRTQECRSHVCESC